MKKINGLRYLFDNKENNYALNMRAPVCIYVRFFFFFFCFFCFFLKFQRLFCCDTVGYEYNCLKFRSRAAHVHSQALYFSDFCDSNRGRAINKYNRLWTQIKD